MNLLKLEILFLIFLTPGIAFAADAAGGILLFSTLGLILPALLFGSIIVSNDKRLIAIIHVINILAFSFIYVSRYSNESFSKAFEFIALYSFISMLGILAFSIVYRVIKSYKKEDATDDN